MVATESTAAAVNGDNASSATAMTLSVSENGLVEVAKSPLLSPTASDTQSFLEVFEDTDSDISSTSYNNEDDPWRSNSRLIEDMVSVEVKELQWQLNVQQNDSVDSAMQELQPMASHETTRRSNTSRITPESLLHSPESSHFRSTRRASAFAAIVPVGLKDGASRAACPSLEAIAQQVSEEEEEDDTGPSFREFALLSWSTNKLSLLGDENLFVDDGPRPLDAFLLSAVDFVDIYPPDATADSINPKALSRFCFPDGLRVRIIPRVAMPGAMQKGWAGVGGDKCHVVVFTDGYGKTQHGVVIKVRQEIPLTVNERERLRKIVRVRHRRRMAASRISRWWKLQEQNRMLKEALVIAGCQQYSIEELKAELSTSELKLLQDSLRNANRNEEEARLRKMNSLATSVLHWQNKSTGALMKMMQSPQKRMGNKESALPNGASKSSHNLAEVESLTKNAIKRSALASTSSTDGDCGSEITDDTEPSESSTDNSEKKRNRLHKIAERMVNAVNSPPTSPRGDSNAVAVEQALDNVPIVPKPKRKISEWAQEKGRESYQAMKHAAKHGIACIMEKCYVLVGCRPDEHVLLLGPLQQLVNAERKEINDCRASSRGLPIDEWVERERRVLDEQRDRRHRIIEAMLEDLRLSRGQAAISFPRNYLDYIVERKHYFETTLPIPNASPIKLPLPLPSIGKQWGLSRLLFHIGPDSLVLMIKLLLMERSVLVLGENLEDVTSIACSLLELLEPFEWRSVFLPVLPQKMLDFVASPVPFVAGMAVNDYARVCEVEMDLRTVDAMANGMSLLNLSTNTLHITSEADISKYLSLDPYLREQLQCIRGRLHHLAENPSSSLHSFQCFIRTGFSPKESVTLDSACVALENHFSRYCADLAVSCTAWKQYGTIHVETGKFAFQPDWFMNRLHSEQVFHEAMLNTQLFMGYVDERRRDQMEVEQMKRGKVGKFIAQWIYERWVIFKERNSPVEV